MRKSYFFVSIILIKRIGALGAQFISDHVRLSAPSDASSRAGHNFHKMIRRFLAFFLGLTDLIDDIFHITQTVSDGQPDLFASDYLLLVMRFVLVR